MMATIEQNLKPWITPNFATVESPIGKRQDGFHPSAQDGIPIADLPDAAFKALVTEWLRSVYDKAGKRYDWRFD